MSEDKLATLRRAHAKRLRETREELENMKTLMRFNLFAETDRARLIHLAHLEAGAAGAFGLADLGDAAQDLEETMRVDAAAPDINARLERFLGAIDAALV